MPLNEPPHENFLRTPLHRIRSIQLLSLLLIFKHVALPLLLIHHKLIQFIGMSSSRWKGSYDKGRIYNIDGKRHFFG